MANWERVDHVAHLIHDQLAAGYRPRAVVCSAMGKTTNSLLSAGEFALGTFSRRPDGQEFCRSLPASLTCHGCVASFLTSVGAWAHCLSLFGRGPGVH